jgi:uncharacterized protein
MIDRLLSIIEGGVRLYIKARPGINKARAPHLITGVDGKTLLEITVAAAPEDGKANKAICQQMAKALRLKKADIIIKSGANARLKVVEIVGNPKELQEKVAAWILTEE